MSTEDEQQGLAQVIDSLKTHGWFPTRIWDGECTLKVTGWESAKIAEECSQTDEAWLHFEHLKHGGWSNYIYLVWGNSPDELIADHTLNADFGLHIDAACRVVFPEA